MMRDQRRNGFTVQTGSLYSSRITSDCSSTTKTLALVTVEAVEASDVFLSVSLFLSQFPSVTETSRQVMTSSRTWTHVTIDEADAAAVVSERRSKTRRMMKVSRGSCEWEGDVPPEDQVTLLLSPEHAAPLTHAFTTTAAPLVAVWLDVLDVAWAALLLLGCNDDRLALRLRRRHLSPEDQETGDEEESDADRHDLLTRHPCLRSFS